MSDERAPIDMLLWCPVCHAPHVDAPDGAWTNPPHKSHLCHGCGTIWRPADVATNGVAAIETKGGADTWPRDEPTRSYDLTRPPDDERALLFGQMQTLGAGHSSMAFVRAALDSAAIAVAFLAADRAAADAVIAALLPDMKRTMSDNWDVVREARAQAGDAGRA